MKKVNETSWFVVLHWSKTPFDKDSLNEVAEILSMTRENETDASLKDRKNKMFLITKSDTEIDRCNRYMDPKTWSEVNIDPPSSSEFECIESQNTGRDTHAWLEFVVQKYDRMQSEKKKDEEIQIESKDMSFIPVTRLYFIPSPIKKYDRKGCIQKMLNMPNRRPREVFGGNRFPDHLDITISENFDHVMPFYCDSKLTKAVLRDGKTHTNFGGWFLDWVSITGNKKPCDIDIDAVEDTTNGKSGVYPSAKCDASKVSVSDIPLFEGNMPLFLNGVLSTTTDLILNRKKKFYQDLLWQPAVDNMGGEVGHFLERLLPVIFGAGGLLYGQNIEL